MTTIKSSHDHVKFEGSALFRAMDDNWTWRNQGWVATTDDMFNEQLGAVPPTAYNCLGFLSGECAFHNANGHEVFSAFIIVNGQVLARYMTAEAFASMDRCQINQVELGVL